MKTHEIYIVLQAILSSSHENIYQSINEILTDGRCRSMAFIKKEYNVPFKLYFEGYKYDEIPEMFSIPVATVKPIFIRLALV